jgi:hypothetical protein
MLIWVAPIRRALDRLRTKDPDHDGLRRALRATIMVSLAAGFSLVAVGGAAAPRFAVLGAHWLMVVTAFPGNRQNRAVGLPRLGRQREHSDRAGHLGYSPRPTGQ